MSLAAFELCMDNEKNHISAFTTIKHNFLCMDNSNPDKL